MEVLVVALVGSILVVSFALNAFAAQKASFAAQQLARQGVRLAAQHQLTPPRLLALRMAAAEGLRIAANEVKLDLQTEGAVGVVLATIKGQTATAKMYLEGK